MNWKPGKNKLVTMGVAAGAMALVAAGLVRAALAEPPKGYDTEWGFQMKALSAKGAVAPAYAQEQVSSKLVVSDLDAGGGAVLTVGVEGGVAAIAGKVKEPAGVAVAPAGFGSHAGEIFVLAPDADGLFAVNLIDKSGAVKVFAKLPDAGLEGGKAKEGRDLEFGLAGSPFAGKLYAATNGNAVVYEINASGQARPFSVFDKPPWEITNIGFTAANDPLAPNAMLIGTRPRMPGGAKLGRISVVDGSGKMRNDPYLVGFIRPTGFAFAPAGFGSYAGVLFIADAGRWATDNSNARDGAIYRVDKGVARSFATGMVDPNSLKFVGRTLVICDPSGGKSKGGAIVVITSMF